MQIFFWLITHTPCHALLPIIGKECVTSQKKSLCRRLSFNHHRPLYRNFTYCRTSYILFYCSIACNGMDTTVARQITATITAPHTLYSQTPLSDIPLICTPCFCRQLSWLERPYIFSKIFPR